MHVSQILVIRWRVFNSRALVELLTDVTRLVYKTVTVIDVYNALVSDHLCLYLVILLAGNRY